MTAIRFASVGSISTGTLRDEDLLDTFASELEYHVNRNAAAWCSDEGRAARDRYMALIWDAREYGGETANDDGLPEIISDLEDALQAFAPPYCYFGTLEGDGADFGFWPSMDEIRELPQVADPADIPEGGTGEDVAYVNDHGNVTVYGGDGSVVLDIV